MAMAQGAASGKNEVENNWLSPKEWQQLDRDNAACAKGNQAACQDADRLNQKSYEKDVDLRVSCGVDGTSDGCQKESTKAVSADNTLATNNAGDVIAYNPKYQKPSDLDVAIMTDGSVSPQVKGSFEYKAAGALDSSVANGTKLFVIDPLISVGVGGAELSDGEYANGAIDLVSGVLGVTLIGKGVGIGVDAGKAALEGADAGINFANDAKLEEHFIKHGVEFNANSKEEYLNIGRDIIDKGTKVKYQYGLKDGTTENREGYVMFMGNSKKTGNAKFGFVGTNLDQNITTIHIEQGKSFWKMLNGNSSIKQINPAP
jgi:hypothetical protein